MSDLTIREIPPGESLKPFIDLAWTINAGDPLWVAPLRMTLAAVLDRKKHPFHRNAEVAYFLAERGGRPVGRIAAIVNRRHNGYHGDRTGFFGLFECEDDGETARALMERAADWLRARGMETMLGPTNLSTNEELASPGVLVEGFDTPPALQMTHNPPYYAALLEGAGLEKAKDLLAFWLVGGTPPERIVRGFQRAMERHGVSIRPLDMKRFREEVDTLKELYNSAWSRNWGFVPMTDEEFEHLAKEFRPIADPDLCLIAEIGGKPVGFSLSMPDLNEAFRYLPDGKLFPFGLLKFLWYKRKIRGIRMMTLGFRPEYHHVGLGAAFYLGTWQAAMAKGYMQGEASWVLEDNHEMVRAIERMGGQAYKRYRMYQRKL